MLRTIIIDMSNEDGKKENGSSHILWHVFHEVMKVDNKDVIVVEFDEIKI